MKNQVVKDIAISFAGITIMAIGYLLMNLDLILSISLGILMSISLWMMFSNRVSEATFAIVEGITNDVYKKTIAESTVQLQEIRSLAKLITVDSVRFKVESICRTVGDILDKVEKDPKKIKLIRRFFSNHLNSTTTILKRYVQFSSQRTRTTEMNELILKVETLLDTIQTNFETQLGRAMKNEVVDLDVEIQTLENLLKSEGVAL
jgi:5-bromo-4-chloroindolyl phosphate hydrolysis protein